MLEEQKQRVDSQQQVIQRKDQVIICKDQQLEERDEFMLRVAENTGPSGIFAQD